MISKSFKFVQYVFFPVMLCFAGCSTSHVVVGKTRPATDPDQIKVFLSPPKRYETIAIVSSDSNGSFRFGAQGKVNAALNRAKKDAAKLGANGLLLQGLGESGGVTVGEAVTSGANTSFVGVSGGGLIKTVSVIAIYVVEE
jgi:hypothetical protein